MLTLPLLVDTIDNQFESQFAAWPFRFFGLKHHSEKFIVDFKPQPELEPFFGYDVTKLENWIQQNL